MAELPRAPAPAPASGPTAAAGATAAASAPRPAGAAGASVPLALFERMHRFVELSRATRRAATPAELGFIVCNRTRDLVPYRQAVLWQRDALGKLRIASASGVSEVDRGSAYVQLLEAIVDRRFPGTRHADTATASETHPILPPAPLQEADATTGGDVPGPDDTGVVPAHARAQWSEDGAPWIVFVPLRADARRGVALLRDAAMSEAEGGVLSELQELYAHADAALAGPDRAGRARGWWQRQGRRVRIGAAIAVVAVLLFPVRLSVVASGQLVARDPAIITAPLNGVVSAVLVEPSARVQAGQVLYRIDDRELAHQLEVAEEELAVAEERVRQSAQRSFDDPDAAGWSGMAGASQGVGVLEHDMQRARAQRDYYRDLLARIEVRAPVDGVALFSSPQDWIGRPVKIGEKVMEVARPTQVAVEAWLPTENAIPLEAGDSVLFYPEAFPLSAVRAEVTTVAYLAEPQGAAQPGSAPGSLAYRVRARVLEADDVARVGQLGTARLHGDRTVFAYLLLRRPLNALRQWAGW
jgi:multidrug efflux pump subunit AcrA (membrane-fusion protein)